MAVIPFYLLAVIKELMLLTELIDLLNLGINARNKYEIYT